MLQSMTQEKKCQQVGFICSSDEKGSEECAFQEQEDSLLTFDNGDRISFADASHNVVVLGTTGSGKTMQAILPALARMVKAGFSGLALDVKGNFANYLRMAARDCGREADVVEFGPGPAATPVNLFWNADMYETEQVIRDVMCFSMKDNGHNQSFFEEGLQETLDVINLYRFMCLKLGRPFRMEVLRKLMSDTRFAHETFKYYMARLHDKGNMDEVLMVQRILSDELHQIVSHMKSLDKLSKARAEQNSYRMKCFRVGMEMLLRSAGIARNFFGKGEENTEIARRVFEEGKIVILRLAPETGPVGERIARKLASEYYQAVFRKGRTLPEGKYTFLIADEMQDFYNSDTEDPYNDNAFVAKCREFRNIAIYGSQSVAAMQTKAAKGEMDCEAFVANCNVRLFLYSDDRKTCDLAPEGLQDLTRLSSGMCNMTKFDVATRDHVAGQVGLERMYEDFQALIARNAPFVPDTSPVCKFGLTEDERAEAFAEVQEESDYLTGLKDKEHAPVIAREKEEERQRRASMSQAYATPKTMKDYVKDIRGILVAMADRDIRNKHDEPIRSYVNDLTNTIEDMIEDGTPDFRKQRKLSDERKCNEVSFQETFDRMHQDFMASDTAQGMPEWEANVVFVENLFPEFFTRRCKGAKLPTGWLSAVCKELSIMKQQSFSPAISGMEIVPSSRNESEPDLDITLENEREKIRNLVRERLHRAIKDTCMVCGKEVEFGWHRGLCEVHIAKVANEGLPRMSFAEKPASKRKKRKAA